MHQRKCEQRLKTAFLKTKHEPTVKYHSLLRLATQSSQGFFDPFFVDLS